MLYRAPLRRLLLCFAFTLLFSAAAFAQSGLGEIAGLVSDPSGGGVARAAVSLTNQDTGVTQSAVSDTDGRYTFTAVPPGKYSVKVEASGFRLVTVTDIEMVIGAHVNRDIPLTLGNVAESVTVSGEVPEIDTTKTEVSGVVSRVQIETLPVNTRQYLNLALLMPGTTQDASRTFYNSVQAG